MRRLLATVGMVGLMLAGTAGTALADGPAQTTTSRQLCQTNSGSYIDLGAVANVCLLPTAATAADIQQAGSLCAPQGGHLFVAVGDIAWACVLPGGASTVTGPVDPGSSGPGVLTSPGGLNITQLLNNLLGTGGTGNGLLGGPGGALPLLNPVGPSGTGHGLLAGPGLLGLFPIRIS